MDQAAFERLYREEAPGLYRLAQSILRHTPDAQDAVQQTALRAWQARHRIHPGQEKAYIARILINECRNIQRRRMRVTPVDEFREAGFTPPDRTLKMAVETLPDKLRLPLLLKYMEGYSEKETASILGVSVPTVKGRLLRARRALEKELREEVELG